MQLFWVNPVKGGRRKRFKLKRAKKSRRTKGLRRKGRKTLFGAAAKAWRKAHKRKKTTKKRGTMARRKRHRNPRRGRTSFAHRMSGFRLNPRRRRQRNPGGLGGGKITPEMIHARAARMAAAKYMKRKRKGKKSLRKAQASFKRKYSAAVKRARRKRARRMGISAKAAKRIVSAMKGKRKPKKGSSMAKKKGKKKGKRSHASYVAAGKKGARTRKAKKAARKGRRKSRGRRRIYSRYLLKARRAIKRGRSRKYGSKRSRRTIRHFKMRTNPGRILAVVKGAVKAALPVVAGYIATKFVINKFGAKIPMLDRLGRHQGPALALLGVVGAHFATRKGPLAKYATGVLVGAGFNLITTLVSEYAPASVKGMLGLGDSGVYDEALAGYNYGTADYVETGEYVAQEDYVEIGAEQDLAGMQELAGGMTAPIPHQRMLAPIPSRPSVAPVPDWTPDFSQHGLYTGLFAKKMF